MDVLCLYVNRVQKMVVAEAGGTSRYTLAGAVKYNKYENITKSSLYEYNRARLPSFVQ